MNIEISIPILENNGLEPKFCSDGPDSISFYQAGPDLAKVRIGRDTYHVSVEDLERAVKALRI